MQKHTSALMRFIITFLSVSIGIGYAFFDGHWAIRQVPHPVPEANQPPTFEQIRFVFEICITFYGTVYLCGRHLYALLGRHTQAAELRQWSVSYIRFLHAFGAILLLLTGWQSLTKFGVVRPSTLLAIALLIQTASDTRQKVQASRRSG